MLDQQLVAYLRKMEVGNRVHPHALPEGYVLPAVVYQLTDVRHRLLHDGTRLSTGSIRLSIWAETYTEAVHLTGQIGQRMLAWRFSGGQVASQSLEEIVYEPGLNIYRSTVVFAVVYQEVV